MEIGKVYQHHCTLVDVAIAVLGCFQPETWNPKYGREWTPNDKDDILNSLQHNHISGLVLLGGEPFMNYNCNELIDLCKTVRDIYGNTKTIVVYSGWTFEEIIKDKMKLSLLNKCDVLVDGKFIQDLYSPLLKFRGSSNQRIIDIKESLKQNKVILYHEL